MRKVKRNKRNVKPVINRERMARISDWKSKYRIYEDFYSNKPMEEQ